MSLLFALLLSMNLVTSSQSSTLTTSQQVNIAVSNNIMSTTTATAMATQPYDPTEGRVKR